MGVSPVWVVIGVFVVGLYAWYASIVSKRNRAFEALSGIDVQLRLRSDLVPNILTIAQKFLDHEKSLMEEITALRSRADAAYNPKDAGSVKEHLAAAEALAGKLGQLMVTVENYPTLKSDQTMIQAQRTYNETEARISAARRFYNSAVTSLNNSVQIFPGNLIARIAWVQSMPFYEADEPAREPVTASDYLK